MFLEQGYEATRSTLNLVRGSKVKLSLFLTKHYAMKTYGEVEVGIVLFFRLLSV